MHKIRQSAGLGKERFHYVKTKTLKPQTALAKPAAVVSKACGESVVFLVRGEFF